jgi:cell division protease FtsH
VVGVKDSTYSALSWGWKLLALVAAQYLIVRSELAAVIPYSRFQQLLREERVASVRVSADELEGDLKEAVDGQRRFVTRRVEDDLAKELDRHGVEYAGRDGGGISPLWWGAPVLLLGALWVYMGRRAAAGPGGQPTMGTSRARVHGAAGAHVSFADVAGVDEARDELAEVVEFLKDPAAHGRLGARMPKGVLLVGPPGTGKTLLARAVAGEAGVAFFSICGSEFVEMFVGVGAARVRDLFEQARAKAPAIVFVDELDALGRARGSGAAAGGAQQEKEQTLNQLLSELDGFDPASGVVVLAATNRPEILDPALLRPGRFDRQVLVDRPDRRGRVAILEVHAARVRLAPHVALDDVAALTPGFTGADLANLVNEAALAATRRGADGVSREDFEVAVERIVGGAEKKARVLGGRERERVAHHELGHAVVSAALPGCDAVRKISIVPRGVSALGFTLQRPAEDRHLLTRDELEDRVAMLLGGRAAEHLAFGGASTGAADDLARATQLARDMVTRFGMAATLGPISYEPGAAGFLDDGRGAARLYAEETAREIDLAVRDVVVAQLERARAILARSRPLVAEAAAVLLAKETLAGAELAALLAQVPRDWRGPRDPPAPAARDRRAAAVAGPAVPVTH